MDIYLEQREHSSQTAFGPQKCPLSIPKNGKRYEFNLGLLMMKMA
jgi:hypothetical protein